MLDRAWTHADPGERRMLDRLRSDFAALALSFAHVSARRDVDRLTMGAAATSGVASNGTAAEPTSAIGPPKAPEAVPPAATSDKRPAEWQVKYAAVEADLKAIPPPANRILAGRLDRFRKRLQLFYAAALGQPPRP